MDPPDPTPHPPHPSPHPRRICQTPTRFGPHLAKVMLRLVLLAAVIHMAVAAWMHSHFYGIPIYGAKSSQQVIKQSHFVIDENKVYTGERHRVVVSNGICICDETRMIPSMDATCDRPGPISFITLSSHTSATLSSTPSPPHPTLSSTPSPPQPTLSSTPSPPPP